MFNLQVISFTTVFSLLLVLFYIFFVGINLLWLLPSGNSPRTLKKAFGTIGNNILLEKLMAIRFFDDTAN